MEVAVDTAGLDALIRALDAADPAQTSLAPFLRAYTEALGRAIPVRGGRMRASVGLIATADQALVEIGAPYALYVVQGVRAQWMTWLVGHTISFVARDGEKVTRRVTRVGEWGGRRHWWTPGQEANNVFQTALDDPKVAELLAELADAGTPVQVAYTSPTGG